MGKQIKCWFTVHFRMRVGQTGWLAPEQTTVRHDGVTLNVQQSMNGKIRTTKWVGRKEWDHDELQPFIIHENDKEELQAVDVSVAIMLDAKRFEEGSFDEGDYERAMEEAKQALLRRFPETSFWQKPA